MRYKVVIAYDGSNYFGSQIQPRLKTIQGEFEKALKNMLTFYVKTYFASRTDKGVHANYQVVHFDLEQDILLEKIKIGLNKRLSSDIRVLSVEIEKEDFHARHSAVLKTYKYIIYKKEMLPPYLRFGVYIRDFNFKKFKEALNLFIGKHDFMGFSKEKEETITIKELNIKIKSEKDKYVIYFKCHSYLKQMIRILIGTAIKYQEGKITKEDILEVFKTRKRGLATYTAPACGLFLDYISY